MIGNLECRPGSVRPVSLTEGIGVTGSPIFQRGNCVNAPGAADHPEGVFRGFNRRTRVLRAGGRTARRCQCQDCARDENSTIHVHPSDVLWSPDGINLSPRTAAFPEAPP